MFCFTISNVVEAAPNPKNISQEQTTFRNEKNYEWALGLRSFQWDYQEVVNGNNFVSDSGILYGIGGRFNQFINNFILGIDAEFVVGETFYDGSQTNLNTGVRTPYQADSTNSIFNSEATLGYLFKHENYFFVPKVGISYRRLRNYNREDDPSDYDRVIEYYYAPIGIQTQVLFSEKRKISLEAFYNNFILGQVETAIGINNTSVFNEQESGSGYEFSISYEEKFKDFNISIGPFYRRWLIEQSEVVSISTTSGGTATVTEPENKTDIYGLSVLFVF